MSLIGESVPPKPGVRCVYCQAPAVCQAPPPRRPEPCCDKHCEHADGLCIRLGSEAA